MVERLRRRRGRQLALSTAECEAVPSILALWRADGVVMWQPPTPAEALSRHRLGWVKEASSEASAAVDSAPGRLADAKRSDSRTCGDFDFLDCETGTACAQGRARP